MMKQTFLASLLSFTILATLGTGVVWAQTGPFNDPGGQGGRSEDIDNPSQDIDNPSGGIDIPNPFSKSGDSLFTLLETIIQEILLPIGGVLAVLAFIYSGFLYVTAQGNASKIETAHKALLYTAIGTAVLLGSWIIANVIENTISKLR